MNNLSKEKQQQLLFVAVVTVIILVGIWFGLIKTQKSALQTATKKTEEARKRVDSSQRMIKQTEAIREELAEVRAELAKREETMASGDYYQWFLTTFNAAMDSRRLYNFVPGPPALVDAALLPKFPYRAAIFNVRLTANYHDIGQFFATLENSFPYARIQNVDLTPVTGPNPEERLSASFDFVTLYHTNSTVNPR